MRGLFLDINTLYLITEVGLAVGIGMSFVWLNAESAFSDVNKPLLSKTASTNYGIDVVSLRSDVTFLSSSRIKDFIISLTAIAKPIVDRNVSTANVNRAIASRPETRAVSFQASFSDRTFYSVTTKLDRYFVVNKPKFVSELPILIVVDFTFVSIIDLTGLQAIEEIMKETRLHGVFMIIINCVPAVESKLIKYGIENDAIEVILAKAIENRENFGSFCNFRDSKRESDATHGKLMSWIETCIIDA